MKIQKNFGDKRRKAFALVVAIGAMAFVVMLTLTLSAVITSKLRLMSAQKEMHAARSNALLGLSVAISEIQRTMGPDAAVSFPSDIFDSDPKSVKIDNVEIPYLVGGKKLSDPDKHKKDFKTLQDEMLEDFDLLRNASAPRNSQISWFISSQRAIKNPVAESILDLNSNVVKMASYKKLEDFPNALGEKVSASLKTKKVDVLAGKIEIENGAYAWWASDESMKAKINLQRQKKYLDGKSTGDAAIFEGPADTRIPQLSYLGFIKELEEHQLNPFLPNYKEEVFETISKISNMDEFSMLGAELEKWAKENKGDYTMNSFSLPVDVTQGRLKEDLTVYIESEFGANDADPIIRGHDGDKNYLGPKYPDKLSYDINMPRMGFLKDYATLARHPETEKDPQFSFFPDDKKYPSERVEDANQTAKHGLYPNVMAVSYSFQLCYEGSLALNSEIRLYLLMYPRIILWNPHNVRLPRRDYVVRLYLPYRLDIYADSEPLGATKTNVTGIAKHNAALVAKYPKKEINLTGAEGEEVEFHPAVYFYGNVSDHSISGSNLQGGIDIPFTDFLSDTSLERGKGKHAEGEGGIPGYPVINLRIVDVAFNPGETLEVFPKDQASLSKVYNSSGNRGDKGVLTANKISNLPELVPGRISTGAFVKAKAGVVIDTGVRIRGSMPNGLENIISSRIDSMPEMERFRPSLSEANSAALTAYWRVYPWNGKKNAVPPSAPKDASEVFAKPGYELWMVTPLGDPKYLTAHEAGFVYDNNKIATDIYIGTNHASAKNKSGPSDFSDGWAHYESHPAMLGARHSVAYYWGNRSSTNGIYEYSANQGPNNHSYNRVSSYSNLNENRAPNSFYGNSVDNGARVRAEYATPIIPRLSEFAEQDWNYNNPNADTYKAAHGGTISGIIFKASYSGVGNDFYTLIDYSAPQSVPLTHAYSYIPSWTMQTLFPVKHSDPSNHSFDAYGLQNPAFLIHSNYLRDNANASRVNWNHGYIASPFGWSQAFGAWSGVKEGLIADANSSFTSGKIDRKHSNSTNTGDWNYLSEFANSPDTYTDRWGASPLFIHTISKMPEKDTGLVMPVFDYPRFKEDLMSLGIFRQAHLSVMHWQPTFAFGESYASPWLAREKILDETHKIMHENELIDISYMLNASIWDRYYLSTLPQDGNIEFKRGMRLANPRHIISSVPAEKDGLIASEKAYANSAAHIMVEGAFNVNSTSYEAWRAFLGGMLGIKKKTLLEGEYPETVSDTRASEFYMPNFGNINPLIKPQPQKDKYGYRDAIAGRNISEADLDELARAIVEEVKIRAPFFSLADFVNRRLYSYTESQTDENKTYSALMGTIAAAIHKISQNHTSKIPNPFNMYTVKNQAKDPAGNLRGAFAENTQEYIEHSKMGLNKDNYMNLKGLPGVLSQGQILQGIAPFLTSRGDTFTIRAYGESKNAMTGNYSKAYCEAVIQRGAEPIEGSDDIVAPASPFGRRFNIVSFRWLTPTEL